MNSSKGDWARESVSVGAVPGFETEVLAAVGAGEDEEVAGLLDERFLGVERMACWPAAALAGREDSNPTKGQSAKQGIDIVIDSGRS